MKTRKPDTPAKTRKPKTETKPSKQLAQLRTDIAAHSRRLRLSEEHARKTDGNFYRGEEVLARYQEIVDGRLTQIEQDLKPHLHDHKRHNDGDTRSAEACATEAYGRGFVAGFMCRSTKVDHQPDE